MKRGSITFIAVILIIVLAVAGYFMFFYYQKCDSKDCFSQKLIKCDKTIYTSETAEMIMQYKIIGKTKVNGIDKCKTDVKLVQLKQGSAELAVLEGEDMNCFEDFGALVMPGKNLKNCHGLLKEDIQEITIQKLQTQIVENIGQLNNQTPSII